MLSSRVFSYVLLGVLVLLGFGAIGRLAGGATPSSGRHGLGPGAPGAGLASVERSAARFDSEALAGKSRPVKARFDAEPLPEKMRVITVGLHTELMPSRLGPTQPRFDSEAWPNAGPTSPRFDDE